MKDTLSAILVPLCLFMSPFLLLFASAMLYGEVLSLEAISTQKVLGFTDQKLDRIKVGMTGTEAIAILGAPFHSNTLAHRAQEWRYTKQKHGNEWGFYHARWLVVSSNNVVVDIEKRRCPIQ